MTHSRYILTFLTLTLVPLLLVSLINLLVDPLGVHGLVARDGFNSIKPRAQRYERLLKPMRTQRLNPDTLILGTSRAAYGLDPQSPHLTADGRSAFNSGVMSGNLRDMKALAQHALLTTTVDTLLVDIDFFMFNAFNDVPYPFPQVVKQSGADIGYRFGQLLMTLPSWDMLDISRATIGGQDEDERLNARGLMINQRKIDQYLRKGGMRTMSDVVLMDYTRDIWTPCPGTTFASVHPQRGQDMWQAFDSLLMLAAQHEVRLMLFTAPVHASLLATLEASGLWPAYEQWQRDLVAHVDAFKMRHPKAQVSLLDFSEINAITTEKIPAAGDDQSIMQGYVDPAHYRTEVGEWVLAELLDRGAQAPATPFVARPTPATIDSLLARRRQALARYRQEQPDIDALATELAARGRALREARNLDCGSTGNR